MAQRRAGRTLAQGGCGEEGPREERGGVDSDAAVPQVVVHPAGPQVVVQEPIVKASKPSNTVLSVLHQESRWESQGGWRPSSRDRRKELRIERDASMVELLNVLDPDSLVDPPAAAAGVRHGSLMHRNPSFSEQHSSLSRRGVVLVGSASALGWYILRLLLRDGLQASGASRNRDMLELHALSTLHAFGWIVFLARKLHCSPATFPQYCSRALVASLGFYLQDCWVLRGTLLHNPAMLLHQATLAAAITSILRSKGVAWLAPPLMSLSLPTLVQEFLQLCGTIGFPATRPEVRGLRLLWFASFTVSKLALVPLWLRNSHRPELHQPNLLLGKLSYLAGLGLNLHFVASAARDLPRFLSPAGALVPAVAAYRVPLRSMQSAGSAVLASAVLSAIFLSYLTAPAAGVLALAAIGFNGSRLLRRLAAALCGTVVLDRLLPTPRECSPFAYVFLPLLRKCTQAFGHRMHPNHNLEQVFRRDRHYLIAATPHGFFPWGVFMILIDLLDQGYLPNALGASVLGALPVAGRLWRTFGYTPATKAGFRRCLEKTYPRNVTVLTPGGIRESFCIREDVELSCANLRTGFVKLARDSGAMIVPAYMLGNSQLYHVAGGSIGKFFERLSRKLRVSFNFFYGRWGTLLPYPHPLACALGEPIDTLRTADAEEAHLLWLQGLRRAFEEHKSVVGWQDRQLFFEGEALPPLPRDPLEGYTALPQLSKL